MKYLYSAVWSTLGCLHKKMQPFNFFFFLPCINSAHSDFVLTQILLHSLHYCSSVRIHYVIFILFQLKLFPFSLELFFSSSLHSFNPLSLILCVPPYVTYSFILPSLFNLCPVFFFILYFSTLSTWFRCISWKHSAHVRLFKLEMAKNAVTGLQQSFPSYITAPPVRVFWPGVAVY